MAHERGDADALVTLYTAAADGTTDIDQACFYLTQAFVFALEAGLPQMHDLNVRLAAHGRAHILPEGPV